MQSDWHDYFHLRRSGKTYSELIYVDKYSLDLAVCSRALTYLSFCHSINYCIASSVGTLTSLLNHCSKPFCHLFLFPGRFKVVEVFQPAGGLVLIRSFFKACSSVIPGLTSF